MVQLNQSYKWTDSVNVSCLNVLLGFYVNKSELKDNIVQ